MNRLTCIAKRLYVALLLASLLISPKWAGAEPLAIVTAPTTELSADRRTLLNVFLLRQPSDRAGHPLTLISYDPGSIIFEQIVSQCLHWNPRIIANRWRRNLYTGEGRVPLLINSWDTMRNTLLKTPYAIGYLPVSQVPEQFKILLTCTIAS